MKMRILALFLLLVSLDSFSMYWAKGGKKPSRPKQQSNKIVSVPQEKTATEKLQEFLKSPGNSPLWQQYGYENKKSNYFLVIEKLIEEGANPNIQDKSGIPLLLNVIYQFTIWVGNPTQEQVEFLAKVVRTLLKYGADVNVVDKFKHTALYIAARANLPGIVKILLENGADVNFMNGKENRTALGEARHSNYTEVIQAIESHTKKNKIP